MDDYLPTTPTFICARAQPIKETLYLTGDSDDSVDSDDEEMMGKEKNDYIEDIDMTNKGDLKQEENEVEEDSLKRVVKGKVHVAEGEAFRY